MILVTAVLGAGSWLGAAAGLGGFGRSRQYPSVDVPAEVARGVPAAQTTAGLTGQPALFVAPPWPALPVVADAPQPPAAAPRPPKATGARPSAPHQPDDKPEKVQNKTEDKAKDEAKAEGKTADKAKAEDPAEDPTTDPTAEDRLRKEIEDRLRKEIEDRLRDKFEVQPPLEGASSTKADTPKTQDNSE